jgi:hypothetical protein
MKKISKINYFRFLFFMLMISTYLPIVFVNLPTIVRSHHIWAVLWLSSLFLFNTQVLKSKSIIYTLLYGALMFILFNTIWINVFEWHKYQIGNEFYQIIIAISVITYFNMSKDYYGLAQVIKWTLIFIFITAIMSIVTSIINPTYARDITGATALNLEKEREEVLSFRKYGGGGYSFASALICLFPILMYYYKRNEKGILQKKYMIVLALVFYYTLLKVQFFGNILISSIIIIYSIFGSKNIIKSMVFTGLLSLLLFLIPIQFYSNVLVSTAKVFNTESVLHNKFNDMAGFIVSRDLEGTETGERASRFPLLWKSFISNPLIGGEYSNGHLHWMNKLAVYGILGTLPFFYVMIYFIKNCYKKFDKEFAFFFMLSVLSIFSLGSIKALVGRDLWYMLLIIIPGMYYLPLLNNHKSKNSLKRKSNSSI